MKPPLFVLCTMHPDSNCKVWEYVHIRGNFLFLDFWGRVRTNNWKWSSLLGSALLALSDLSWLCHRDMTRLCSSSQCGTTVIRPPRRYTCAKWLCTFLRRWSTQCQTKNKRWLLLCYHWPFHKSSQFGLKKKTKRIKIAWIMTRLLVQFFLQTDFPSLV